MKKQRLFREEIKDKHTSHWDLDMMSREELEAFMANKTARDPAEKSEQDSPPEK